jgi:hypothetical protein
MMIASPVTSFAARCAAAERIRALKESVAEAVTDEFFRRHPDLLARYGEVGRKRGIEDACYHLDFLAAAVESGSVAAFCEYARWCRRLLGPMGLGPHLLAENLVQIGNSLAEKLGASAAAESVAAFTHAPCKRASKHLESRSRPQVLSQ